MSSLAFNTASVYYFWAVELDNRTAAAQSEGTDFRKTYIVILVVWQDSLEEQLFFASFMRHLSKRMNTLDQQNYEKENLFPL